MADRKLSELAELTTPATGDEFLVLDASEPTDANKNKRVQFGTLCDHIPDGSVAAPSLGFASDTGDTGFFRSAEDEIAISTADALNSKFTTTGFQVGDGTASAQFHTFKATTGDDVIIENSEAGAAEGPNVVLYRNSASPAADDVLGTLEFRGEDDAGDAQSYAEITAGIVDPTNSSEDGRIDFNTTTAGSLSTVVRLQEGRIGINESAPEAPIHANNADTQILRLECPNNDASSGADIRMYRHRNDAVGQDDDELSTLFFRGHNNDATASQRQVDYAAIQGQIADVTADAEGGKIVFQVQTAGTLTTQFEVDENKLGFFGATAAVQSTHVADAEAAYTANDPGDPSGANITIADGNAPTNAELLSYCRMLEAKVNSLLAFASAHGLMASS